MIPQDKGYSKCKIWKKKNFGCTYRCSYYDFNLQNKCASLSLTMEAEIHNHPLNILWKWITFTCNLCGKEGSGYSKCKICTKKNCSKCTYRCSCYDFNLRNKGVALPPTMEAEVHNHPLIILWKWITFSCNLCGKEGNGTRIYYCLSCNFVIHLNFTMNNVKKKYINLLELNDEKFTQSKNMLENENPKLNQSIDSTTYQKKKINTLCTQLK
ncbi:hypothetical protein CFP56_005713 [Quercus suber]|uniref:DC1 domain-containing protein n=1 Tax=Quercus suber TaxID=58331 RepID=A0AAW0L9Z6_QUESU